VQMSSLMFCISHWPMAFIYRSHNSIVVKRIASEILLIREQEITFVVFVKYL